MFYDHTMVEATSSSIKQWLKTMSDTGWELVSVVHDPNACYKLFFKRPAGTVTANPECCEHWKRYDEARKKMSSF